MRRKTFESALLNPFSGDGADHWHETPMTKKRAMSLVAMVYSTSTVCLCVLPLTLNAGFPLDRQPNSCVSEILLKFSLELITDD